MLVHILAESDKMKTTRIQAKCGENMRRKLQNRVKRLLEAGCTIT